MSVLYRICLVFVTLIQIDRSFCKLFFLFFSDSFEDRVSDEVIRNILQSAADVHMNVVRNWGGGIYQHDSFYNIADELGCVCWQNVTAENEPFDNYVTCHNSKAPWNYLLLKRLGWNYLIIDKWLKILLSNSSFLSECLEFHHNLRNRNFIFLWHHNDVTIWHHQAKTFFHIIIIYTIYKLVYVKVIDYC